jgi:hypothetical protein
MREYHRQSRDACVHSAGHVSARRCCDVYRLDRLPARTGMCACAAYLFGAEARRLRDAVSLTEED